MTGSKIELVLRRLFEKHRIVFWRDAKSELQDDFAAVSLPEVEKVVVKDNEFQIKYRLLREQPEKKFLVYLSGSEPAEHENWLLDLQFAYGQFRTDQSAIWLAEMELGHQYAELTQTHADFFQSTKRRDALKAMSSTNESLASIRFKILAVCASCPDARLDSILNSLIEEAADDKEDKWKLISRAQLVTFFWEQVRAQYGYHGNQASVRDFVLTVFKSCFDVALREKASLTQDAVVFLKRWKDSRQYERSFETFSSQFSEALQIENRLHSIVDVRDLMEVDYFEIIEKKIIAELVRMSATRTASSQDVLNWLRTRKQSHWYRNYESDYRAIEFGARFIVALSEIKIDIESFSDGVHRYTKNLFVIDQMYRKFVYYRRKSQTISLTASLAEQIENLYVNSFLLKLSDRWQGVVDKISKWNAAPIHNQREFFATYVQPFLRKDNKVCVIISDAFRYEIGEELLNLIRQEDRFTADLDCMVSALPSFTQLGMAALLPNKSIGLSDDESGTVKVDGQSTQGTAYRARILEQAVTGKTKAIDADTLLSMKSDDCRILFRENTVVYVYHDRIDQVGDNRDSEERVFEAVEEALQDIVKLIKKLTSANASNLIVTADHGFLYQNRPVEEADFLPNDVEGEQVLYRNRRFILGKALKSQEGFRKFSSGELGLEGDVDVLIPKSLRRIRQRGSGSKFVHGGATLQEIVIPVLKINKKRQSDMSIVGVEVLAGATSIITTGQLSVVLYQEQAASEKVQPRTLRMGIYTEGDELISDSCEITFDSGSENPRDRERSVKFILSQKANEFNGKDVYLKLKEKYPGTSHYQDYKSCRYTLRPSFTRDFDF